MTALSEFCERLQDRLGVDDSYLAEDLPNGVRRSVRRLLRDYHFPKQIKTHFWMTAAGTQTYTLPSDMKKPLMLMFQDISNPSAPLYGDPLLKREGFIRADSDGVGRYYWLQGPDVWTDVTIPAGTEDTRLIMAYESNDPDTAMDWMLQDYEDVLFSLCMFRLAGEYGKPELAQMYVAMWTEDQRSLAIFTNELEFDGQELLMREAAPRKRDRYPAQ